MSKYVKLDDWIKKIIVDPLSKENLVQSQEKSCLISPYGRKYPIIDNIYDLRLLNNITTKDQKEWTKGQVFYEEFSNNWSKFTKTEYEQELEGVRGVYEDIPIQGDCLDVGGHQGRLRAFIKKDQKYVCCDPFLNIFSDIERQPNLIKVYPFLLESVNFVACDAEFLPFKSSSFDTVHMRSVLDHFLNPELALNEAYRVLRTNGSLILGLYVEGGKVGKLMPKDYVKEIIRKFLPYIGINKYNDYHVWHPTYKQLIELIELCGFSVDRVHWQKGWQDTVCYIKAIKNDELFTKFRIS